MIFLQLTGLSGAGKSTIAKLAKEELQLKGYRVEVIDADVYRPVLCKDLGYSEHDRKENIRRLGFVGNVLSRNGVISILAAINPFEEIRKELKSFGSYVKTIWIKCDLDTLIKRDTKGLYKRALLANEHPEKLHNLTGVNDRYDEPLSADLIIDTATTSVDGSVRQLVDFILNTINEDE